MPERPFIHNSADVKTDNIGADTTIWQNNVILEGARIGNNVNINAHCLVEGDVIIGDNVTIKSGVYLWNGIVIEDGVQVGPNATFTNDKYPRAKNSEFEQRNILIKEGASIGAAATVMGGVTVGRYSLIGAASLVNKDVPDYALVYGHPAEQYGFVCECAHHIDFSEDGYAQCLKEECRKQYQLTEEGVIRIQ